MAPLPLVCVTDCLPHVLHSLVGVTSIVVVAAVAPIVSVAPNVSASTATAPLVSAIVATAVVVVIATPNPMASLPLQLPHRGGDGLLEQVNLGAHLLGTDEEQPQLVKGGSGGGGGSGRFAGGLKGLLQEGSSSSPPSSSPASSSSSAALLLPGSQPGQQVHARGHTVRALGVGAPPPANATRKPPVTTTQSFHFANFVLILLLVQMSFLYYLVFAIPVPVLP